MLIAAAANAPSLWMCRNFPVSTSIGKICDALVAGNAVLVKPSPHTPLTMCRIGELWREIVPPGLVQVIPGGDDVGSAIVTCPGMDYVTCVVHKYSDEMNVYREHT
jgi:acyl-CoA reductase-like NAD-dependent aldehyde dehydrogenase